MGYEISEDKVLPPFGSGCSCIDTINGECLRGKTIDECVNICKESKYCKMGMFIKSEKSPSYCLPLNSLNYLNYPIDNFFVNTKNTKFSDMEVKFFYDKDYYATFESKNILFNNSNVFLKYKDKYLNINLQFGEKPKNAFKLSVSGVDDYNRIYNESSIKITTNNLTKILIHVIQNNKLVWSQYNSQNLQQNLFILEFNKKFLNYKDNFNIYFYNLKLEKFYLNVNTNKLIVSKDKPKTFLFSFENDTSDDNMKEVQQFNTDIMKKYLNNFIKSNKSQHYISLEFFLIIFIYILFFVILLKIVLFKKQKFFENKK